MKNRTIFLILITLLVLAFGLVYFNDTQSKLASISTTKIGKVIWEVNYKEYSNIVTQPLLVNDKLFIQTNHKVSSYNALTGELIWESEISLSDSWSQIPMQVDQSRLFVQSQRNLVSVFDQKNGELIFRWESPNTNSFIEDLSFNGNTLFVSSYNSDISAINMSDGSLVWINSNVPSRNKLDIFYLNGEVIALATYYDINLYDINNGHLIQTYMFDFFAESHAQDNNHLYISFDDERNCTFLSFDLNLMRDEWCVKVDFDFLLDDMKATYDTSNVYFFGNKMFAIDKENGKILWEISSESSFSNPVILSDFIYVSDNGYLYKIDKLDGTKLTKMDTLDYFYESIMPIRWSPIVTSNLIYMFNGNAISAFENNLK